VPAPPAADYAATVGNDLHQLVSPLGMIRNSTFRSFFLMVRYVRYVRGIEQSASRRPAIKAKEGYKAWLVSERWDFRHCSHFAPTTLAYHLIE
jgi:hypothetical protein